MSLTLVMASLDDKGSMINEHELKAEIGVKSTPPRWLPLKWWFMLKLLASLANYVVLYCIILFSFSYDDYFSV